MTRTAVRFAIYAATAVGVFWLPFHVPPLHQVYSVSQAFHFNNQVAILALLAGVGIAALWGMLGPQPHAPQDTPENTGQLPWWPLALACAVSSVELTMITLASGWLPMDSAAYFVYKLFEMQAGAIPYRDFEFAYGPAMLYVPVFLRAVTGISVNAAYLASLWIFAWGGLLMLWWVVRQARAARSVKIAAFLLLASFPALNPEFGISYTMTRYIAGFAALAAARIAVEKLTRRWALVGVCHTLLTAAVFSISPEVGLAFCAALLVYWISEYRAGCRWILGSAAVQIVLVAGLAAIAPHNTFLAIFGFSAGGNNLPIFPSPYVLLYIGSLMLGVAPLLADAGRTILFGQEQGVARYRIFGAATGAFAVHTLAMIPAALDRPDTGHVIYNGAGAFLLAMLMPWPKPRAGRREVPLRWLYQGAFIVIFPILSVWMGRGYMLPGLEYLAKLRVAEWSNAHAGSALAGVAKTALGPGEWDFLQGNSASIRRRSLENSFPALNEYGKVCDPVGEPEIYAILGRHDALKPEYYFAITDETPLSEVIRKVDDVRACAYVILPGDALRGLPPVLPLDLDYYSQLLMFPVWGPPKFPPPAPKKEFFRYVKDSFVAIRQVTPGMYLCKKRAGAP